ncbi:RDD family protein [Peribacillus sp. B-H-3]|uniref:RDD family protein n=1 Tax=Peribacillus sp. B-H-3 TaxID=3400420 RepID=UPI003B014354
MEFAELTKHEEKKEYAGFWIRAAAYLIDGIIVGIPLYAIYFVCTMVIVGAAGGFSDEALSDSDSAAIIIGMIILFLITFITVTLYFSWMHSSKWQATLGKKIVGLKVTDLQGNRISFWRAFGRLFAMYLSGIFYIGYIMAAFTEKKQSLHDLIAGTVVVKSRN